ncbi:hypothetical protein [Magnetospirillum aberrantis]|uniref:Uncharacterized protein n=1 Tax=Magnetospirillum aberrantis SpK TaxID=908842 RepID=A0A7C9UYL0_9PROT|nr:hypothetical protein [Magnetospirillum aberrantis]NFV79975.1 hypothetical protein [Magnetospirillum aberrantis SpK]
MVADLSSLPDWHDLKRRLDAASGPDFALDAALASPGVTESAEAALAWARAALPDWHMHVGFDVSGVLPYAAFSCQGAHVEAAAPTVPLAVLRAAVAVLAGDFG